MERELAPEYYFNLKVTALAELFAGVERVWSALDRLEGWLTERVKSGVNARLVGQPFIDEGLVEIGEGTVVEHGAVILPPVLIGRNCQIRCGAYLRGGVLMADNCVVGNGCEVKGSILLEGATVPHLNYVGDSILGVGAHVGAGVKLSNLKLDGSNVRVTVQGETVDTGRRKFGAAIGDHSELGCNTVLNPGSLVGPGCLVYPNVSWRGFLPAGHMLKLKQELHIVQRRSG